MYPDPPDHLVPRPPQSRWRRIGIGTAPFNLVALLALFGLSSFVVLSPGSQVMLAGSAGPPASHAPSVPSKVRTDVPTRPTRNVTAYHEPLVGPSTTQSPATTEAVAHLKTTPTTSGSLHLTTAEPQGLPKPKPITCDSFRTQPESQAVFDTNRAALAGLDGDGDGVACEQLPGRVPTTPKPRLVIPATADLMRPSTHLYGVHTANAPYRGSELAEFTKSAGGKHPNNILFFTTFSEAFPAEGVTKSWATGALPIVGFEPIVTNGGTQPLLRDITGGRWDAFFHEWARQAKALDLPFAFRFAQEMNGDWYSWSDGELGNHNGDYIPAWRHVHDIFESEHVDNAIWVWSVNRVDNLPDKTLARVYPGDAYVDWAGISGYYREVIRGVAPSFDGTFARTLTELHRVAPSKPVMLTEVGAGTTVANRTIWMASFFGGLLDHPEILGFCWFNEFKDEDWRIQYSTATAAAFATGVRDIRYGPLVHFA
jgi:hypothetical protein